MFKNTPALLYVIASILSVIALIMDNERILLITKPMIIPALLFYYYSSKKNYFSGNLMLILLVYFISDAMTLVNLPDLDIYNLILDFIPYILLTRIGIGDSIRIGYQKRNFYITIFCYVAQMIFMVYLLQSLNKESSEYSLAIMIYGSVLALFISSCIYNYLRIPTDFTMYVLIGVCFSLIADIIYVVNQMIYFVSTFEYIEFVFQIISYFFIVVYFVRRDVKILKTQQVYI